MNVIYYSGIKNTQLEVKFYLCTSGIWKIKIISFKCLCIGAKLSLIQISFSSTDKLKRTHMQFYFTKLGVLKYRKTHGLRKNLKDNSPFTIFENIDSFLMGQALEGDAVNG